jgi:small GTP-binding protein
MVEELITAIVYTEIHDMKGPIPTFYYPPDLDEDIQLTVAIKSSTILATDQGILPNSLVFIPFPALNLKGIIKYMSRKDDDRRGGSVHSALTLLFKEMDDLIFYKYSKSLEKLFNETAEKIIEIESVNPDDVSVLDEIKVLHQEILDNFDDLNMKECADPAEKPFPVEETTTDAEYVFKIVVIGDAEVGKTSVILRYTNMAFKRTYLPTIGVNVCEKKLKINGSYINFIIWDIAGQQKFNLMRKHFYLGADALIFAFDLTNLESFESIGEWKKDTERHLKDANEKIGIILGNKKDLLNKRNVDRETAKNLAKELNLLYCETSALTGENIKELFNKISELLLNGNNQ